MVELIVVACLLAAPADCREHRVNMTLNGMDAGQCMYKSVIRVARWQSLHSKWKVKSWKCEVITGDRRA